MTKQAGQALMLLILVVSIVLIITMALVGGATLYFQSATYALNAEKATALAEAGVDKAIVSLNKNPSYTGEIETVLGDGSYAISITTKDAATKIIESTGYIPDKLDPKVKRTIKIVASKGIGLAFNYGVQVGEGGLEMKQNSRVNGSVYSNGNIKIDNNAQITGDAWVAGGVVGIPDQQNECIGVNCSDFIFGKTVNGENHLDVAQSFQISSNSVVSKVALKLKKTGNPPDITVRILKDKNGSPDKSEVRATGTLYAGLVTTSYGFVEVTFVSSPNLKSDEKYWLMVDTSEDSSNYWSWSNDLAQSYTRGAPKWSPSWNTSSPSWNSISGDLDFKVYDQPIEEVKITEGPFDLITSFQVLEHIEEPQHFLEAIYRNLKPDGYLYLELPNLNDVLVSTYQVKGYIDFFYHEPHVSYFSEQTLKKLLHKVGFDGEVKTVQRYNILNHINWMLTGKPMDNFTLGNKTPELVTKDTVDKKIKKELNDFIQRTDKEYKELINKFKLGESLSFLGKKSK